MDFKQICTYIQVSWSTVVDFEPMASFSIATTPTCKGGRYFFLWIAPLTLAPYLIMLSVKQGGTMYHCSASLV